MKSKTILTRLDRVIKILIIFFVFNFSFLVQNYAQVGINTDGTDPHASAMLDIKSTNKGILIPRMTTTQRTNINSPAIGLLVFDTTTESFWFSNATSWIELKDGALTTTLADADNDTKIEVEKSSDEDKIRLTVDGNEALHIDNAGQIGIGKLPTAPFDLDMDVTGADTVALEIKGNVFDYFPYINPTIHYQLVRFDAEYTITKVRYYHEAGADNSGASIRILNSSFGNTTSNTTLVYTGNNPQNYTNYTEFDIPNLQVQADTIYSFAFPGALKFVRYTDNPYPEVSNASGDIGMKILKTPSLNDVKFTNSGLVLGNYTLPYTDGSNGQALLTDGGGSLTWTTLTDNDNQDLTLTNNTLSLTGDNTDVDLSGFMDNTDNQDLALSNHILSISNGVTNINLSDYANDNTVILQDADSDTKIEVEQSSDEDKIRLTVDGSEALHIDNNGQIGIGKVPTTKLDIDMGYGSESQVINIGKDPNSNPFINSPSWQSFTSPCNCAVSKLRVNFASSGLATNANNNGTLSIYEGQGTGGNLIYTTTNSTSNGSNVFFTVDNLLLSANSIYTFQVSSPGVRVNPLANYTGGVSSIPNTDVDFGLFTRTKNSDIQFTDNGLVLGNYTVPYTDGNNGQALITDGSGTLIWTTLSDNDNQDLTLTNSTLSLTGDNTDVDLSGFMDNTDNQDLTLTNNTLSLTGDNTSVNLSPYLDNTDNQDLTLTNNTLSLTGDNTDVDLSGFMDNTDNQDLSLSNHILSITNGTSNIDLTAYANSNVILVQDNDNDTKIQVEESSDDDIIRFDVAGSEQMTIGNNGVTIKHVDGSVIGANTTLRFSNGTGTNTIINKIPVGFNPAVPSMEFSVDGNNTLKLDGNGGVKVNNNYTLPTTDGSNNQVLTTDGNGNTYWTTLTGSGGNQNIIQDADNDTKIQVEESADEDIIRFDVGGNERLTLNANGDLVTNTTATRPLQLKNTTVGKGAYLEVNNQAGTRALFGADGGSFSGGSTSDVVVANWSNGALRFHTNATERLKINSDGKVGIGRTATSNTLEVNGNASKSSSGNWSANSDKRLKKNITALSSEQMLHNLLSLQGVTYEWNDTITGNNRPTGIQYGFTAQNIQVIFPTLVEEDAQGYLQTAYGTYDAMTVEAIRALNNKIESQSNKIAALEKENAALQAQAAKIQQLEKMFAQLQEQMNHQTTNSSSDE